MKLYDGLAAVEQEAIARIDSGEAEQVTATLLVGFFETREPARGDGAGAHSRPAGRPGRAKAPA